MLLCLAGLTLGLLAGFAPPSQLRSSRIAMSGPPGGKSGGKGGGKGGGAVLDPNSFVQGEMRGAAMALHTRDQAREGQQPAQKPVSAWQPGRPEYLQFLVDSRHVYATFEEIVASTPEFAPFRDSGLERAEALDRDIAWFAAEGVPAPSVASQGSTYADHLRSMVASGDLEALVCHFYNFYFAHTAGGRQIGKQMARALLDDRTLDFYAWDKGDVDKELLPGTCDPLSTMPTWLAPPHPP
jgi:hypothetical protein